MRVVGSVCRGLRSGYPYPTGELSDLGKGAWLSAQTFNAPGCSSARRRGGVAHLPRLLHRVVDEVA